MKSSLICKAIALLVLQLFAVQSQVIPYTDEDYLDPEAVAMEIEDWDAEEAEAMEIEDWDAEGETAEIVASAGMWGGCYNKVGDAQCQYYQGQDLCSQSAKVRLSYCRKTCGSCTEDAYENNEDNHKCRNIAPLESCERLILRGYCERFADIRTKYCKKTCGSCDEDGEENSDEEYDDFDEGDYFDEDEYDYDEDEFLDDDEDLVRSEVDECIDEAPQESCELFKEKGHCEEYDDVKNQYCRKTCGTCGDIHEEEDDEDEDEGKCFDRAPRSCKGYMKKGFCELYAHVRDTFCRKTCQTCVPSEEDDDSDSCQNQLPNRLCRRFAKKKFCVRFEGIRDVVCPRSCGACSGF